VLLIIEVLIRDIALAGNDISTVQQLQHFQIRRGLHS